MEAELSEDCFEAAAPVTERFYVARKVPLASLRCPPRLCILSHAPKSNQIEWRKQVLAATVLSDEPCRLGGHLLPVRPAGGSGAAIICSDKGRFRGGHGVARVHMGRTPSMGSSEMAYG